MLYLCTSDCTKRRKLFPETFIINTIIKIFHIKVNTLKKEQENQKRKKKKTTAVLKYTSQYFISCVFSFPPHEPSSYLAVTEMNVKQVSSSLSYFACQLKMNLVSGDPILLHLFKFALKFRLPFHFFLSSTNVNLFSIELLSIHLIHSLIEITEILITNLEQRSSFL